MAGYGLHFLPLVLLGLLPQLLLPFAPPVVANLHVGLIGEENGGGEYHQGDCSDLEIGWEKEGVAFDFAVVGLQSVV